MEKRILEILTSYWGEPTTIYANVFSLLASLTITQSISVASNIY